MPDHPAAESHWFLLPLVLALAGTWLALGYTRRRGLLDQPGERRSHSVATPRGGGISIAVVLLGALQAAACADPSLRPVLQAGALGLLLVGTAGWIDDHRPLSAKVRLAMHALSGGLLGAAVLMAGHGVLLTLVAFAAVLVLVNVWNFMDGIDGLAASQAAIAGLGLALIPGAGAGAQLWLALALTGACCGFLPFNFPKARIFLGDVGSGALGQGLAVLLVVTLIAPEGGLEQAEWPLLLLPLAAFLIDAGLTLARRIWRRERWWEPHVQHAYQAWSRTLGRHTPVTLAYAGWSVFGVGLALGIRASSDAFIIVTLAMLAWGLAGGLAWVLLQRASRDRKGRTEGQ